MSNPPIGDRPQIDYATPPTRGPRPWYGSKRRVVLALAAALAIVLSVNVVSFLAWYLPFSARVDRAEARAAALTAAVAADARFANVQFVSETHSGGGMGVVGYVAAPTDLAALKVVVGAATKQLPVFWRVGVFPPKGRAATREAGPDTPDH